MLGPLLFILYTSEMFELMENRLYAYSDDSKLLSVVRKPSDRAVIAASLNWCRILNPNKVDQDLVLSEVSIRASPNLDILSVN